MTNVYVVDSRLAIHAIGDYIAWTLNANPAVPPDLEIAVQKLSLAWQKITLDQIAQATRSELDSDYRSADSLIETINGICG